MKDCQGCGKRPTARSTYDRRPLNSYMRGQQTPTALVAKDEDFVLVRYNTPNRSQQHLYGTVQFEYRMQLPGGMKGIDMEPHPQAGWRFYYGYRKGGDIFLVHREDAERERYLEPVEPVRSAREIELPTQRKPQVLPPPPPPPKRMTIEDVVGSLIESAGETLSYPPDMPPIPEPSLPSPDPGQGDEQGVLQAQLNTISDRSYLDRVLREEFHGQSRPWAIAMIRERISSLDGEPKMPYSKNKMDFQQLPGIGKTIAEALRRDGYETVEDVLSLGVEGLREYRGIGREKAVRIIGAAEGLMQS